MQPIIFLPMFIGVLIFISYFFSPKGSIMTREDETDKDEIRLTGHNATGKVTVKNTGNSAR